MNSEPSESPNALKATRERKRLAMQRWRAKNLEHVRAYMRDYMKRYCATHPEYRATRLQNAKRRRARKKAAQS